VANAQSVTTAEDTARAITLTGSDVDGDVLTYAVVAGPAHGALSGSAPNLTYTPATNYNGPDSFTFKANDGKVDSAAATVSITITPVNDAPVAVNDGYSTNRDTPLTVAAPGVLGNDTDQDGDTLTAILNSGPSHGSLSLNANGGFTYTPTANYTGPDSFTYHARDGSLDSNVATVAIMVTAVLPPQSLNIRVRTGSDDAEEFASGNMTLTSGDLEFVYDDGTRSDQTVGMRFAGIAIPRGATITNAYIQFKVDEIDSESTFLTIQGENVDQAATFTDLTNGISSRPRTAAAISWSPNPWTIVGAAGIDQQTPNIASVIQEIVNRVGWGSGNSLVIIITGTGRRTAESRDGDYAGAPLLHVEYRLPVP